MLQDYVVEAEPHVEHEGKTTESEFLSRKVEYLRQHPHGSAAHPVPTPRLPPMGNCTLIEKHYFTVSFLNFSRKPVLKAWISWTTNKPISGPFAQNKFFQIFFNVWSLSFLRVVGLEGLRAVSWTQHAAYRGVKIPLLLIIWLRVGFGTCILSLV